MENRTQRSQKAILVDETVKKMNEVLEISQEKIVLEANLGYNVGIYDEKEILNGICFLLLLQKFLPTA